MEKVTLGTIADICGVSRQAVSYALNNTGRLSEEKREEIIKIAKSLNYLPNAVARQMRKSSFDCLGLIFREGQIFLPPTLLSGISQVTSEIQFDLKVSEIQFPGADNTTEMPKALRELSVDGFLIDFIPVKEQELINTINNHSVPSIWVNNNLPENSVYPDDFEGARTAVNHAFKHGRKHPVYVDFPWSRVHHYSIPDRFKGYLAAAEANGVKPVTIRQLNEDNLKPTTAQEKRVEEIVSLIRKNPKTDSIFCYDDRTAVMASIACLKLDKQPGVDVDIYGFSSATIALTGLPVYTIKIPFRELGETSVHQLLKRIKTRNSLASVAVPYSSDCIYLAE